MTPLLEAVRQIGRDLIEKRLWPIAVALLAGVVIVPMLITSSSSDAPAPASVASVTPPAPTAPSPAPSGDDASSARRSPTRKVRDPFFDPPNPPAASVATNATADATRAVAAPAGTAAVNQRTAGAAKASPTRATNPTPSTARRPSPRAATAPRGSAYYRAVVHWGDSPAAAPHTLARLRPLGGRRNPAALYLGVAKADALYAVFVLGPNASSRGEGVCRTGTDCRMIALRAGERRSFVVRHPDGSEQRFTLRVRSLKIVETSAAAARRARVRVHRYGRSVLRAMWRLPTEAAVLRRASYDTHVGLLRARPTNVEKLAK